MNEGNDLQGWDAGEPDPPVPEPTFTFVPPPPPGPVPPPPISAGVPPPLSLGSQHLTGGPVPAPPQGKPKRPKGRLALLAVVSIALVTVGIASFIWLLPMFKADSHPGTTAYARLPTPEGTVLVSEAELPIALIPLNTSLGNRASAIASSEGLTVFAAQIDGVDTLFAMDSAAVGRPVWAKATAAPLTNCTVTSKTVNCGVAGTFDLLTGDPLTGESSDSADSADVESESAQDEENPDQIMFYAQSAPTSSDASFHVNGKTLVDAKGADVGTFQPGEVWSISNRDAGGNLEVFTDGQKLIATRGKNVEWELTLPEGSLSVNVQGNQCSLVMGSSALVVGTPQGIVGLSLETGAELWRVAGDVESWLLSDTTLLVSVNGDVHLLSFPKVSDTDEEADDDSEREDSGNQSTPHRELQASDLPIAPTYEDLANSSLQLPEGLTNEIGLGASDYAQLSDGKVKGTQAPGAGFVNLFEVAPLYVGNDAYAVALMDYGIYNSGYFGSLWIIYDADLNMIDAYAAGNPGGFAWFDVEGDFDKQSPRMDAWFLPTVGDTFTYEFVARSNYGGTQTGRVSWRFDGQEATLANFEMDTPGGVSARPDQALLQQIYDDLSVGNDAAAAPYLSTEALDQVQNGYISEAPTPNTMLRGLALPVGGRVQPCLYLDSNWQYDEPMLDSNGNRIGLATSKDFSWLLDYEEPGTWYCGIENQNTAMVDGFWTYNDFLVITTDKDGIPTIERLDRTYS